MLSWGLGLVFPLVDDNLVTLMPRVLSVVGAPIFGLFVAGFFCPWVETVVGLTDITRHNVFTSLFLARVVRHK